MKRPVLIFDFGNVIAFFDYTITARRLAQRTGRSVESLMEQANTSAAQTLFREFECGRLTPEEYHQGVCRDLELELPMEEFAALWCDIFWINAPVSRLIARLASDGYRLILGSNTSRLHADFYRKRFAESLAPFESCVFSFEVGAMKPAPAFYEACQVAAGVPHADCVFIDDLKENVEAARTAGLAGIQYVSPVQLVAELRARNVRSPATERRPL
jgi:putative hydrolase of the HAD superfamily